MIKQTGNKNIRKIEAHENDKNFLREYFSTHQHFPLFQQVLIETRTDCNNHCPFCPHHFNNKQLGVMTWECYKHIIDDLVAMGYNGRVALMVSNEPLLESRLCEMIKYAKQKSPRLFLDITTNGRLLTLQMVDKLFAIGLDNININDYRGDRDIYPDRLSANLLEIANAYSNNPKITIQKRRLDESWPNYGGNIPQLLDESYGFCNFPFRKLVISYDGNVVVCCDDFMNQTSFGNVMDCTLIECWNNEDFNKYRHALLKDNRIGLCAKCNDGQNYSVF